MVEGDPGAVPGDVATPLAVVLNELLQNAADHAFPGGRGRRARSCCRLRRDGPELVVRGAATTARACPTGFDLETLGGLGLSIVRTLVSSELAGHDRACVPASDGTGHGRPDRRADRVPPGVTGPKPTNRRCGRPSREGLPPVREVGAGLSEALALAGEPRPAELAALLLGGAAPDAGVLVGDEGELEAGGLDLALCGTRPWPGRSARSPGRSCRPGRTDRGSCRDRRPGRASRRSRGRCRARR